MVQKMHLNGALSANIHAHSGNVYSASTWIFYRSFFSKTFLFVELVFGNVVVCSCCTANGSLVYLSYIVCFALYNRVWYIDLRSWTAKPPYFRYLVCGPCVELWTCSTQTPWIHRNIYCDAIIDCTMHLHMLLFPIFLLWTAYIVFILPDFQSIFFLDMLAIYWELFLVFRNSYLKPAGQRSKVPTHKLIHFCFFPSRFIFSCPFIQFPKNDPNFHCLAMSLRWTVQAFADTLTHISSTAHRRKWNIKQMKPF